MTALVEDSTVSSGTAESPEARLQFFSYNYKVKMKNNVQSSVGITIPFSEVDEVVWFSGNGVLLPVSNEYNPTQVHTYKQKAGTQN